MLHGQDMRRGGVGHVAPAALGTHEWKRTFLLSPIEKSEPKRAQAAAGTVGRRSRQFCAATIRSLGSRSSLPAPELAFRQMRSLSMTRVGWDA